MKKFIPLLITAILLCGCSESKIQEYSETQFLMDTVCTIRAGGTSPKIAVTSAFDRIYEIQTITDYYSETSEVSAINSADVNTLLNISNDMKKMLTATLDVSEKSNGAFDITIASVKDIWSFSTETHPPAEEEKIKATLPYVGYKKLNLIIDKSNLEKTSECKIDLGGAAKGYAADCAAEVLKSHGCEYAVIDLGGCVYVFGENPSSTDGRWTIGIRKPFGKNDDYSETVQLSEGAVVTAGTYQRYFEWNGKLYHHILNPATGYPSDSGIDSASIIASSALYADCLSTACVVLGKEKGDALARKYNTELIITEGK